MKSALGSFEEEQLLALERMLELVQNVSFGRSLPFMKGIEAATKSIRELYQELKSEGQSYLRTYLLNQDALELFFSNIRGLGGSSDHPRPANFISRFRALVLSSNVENLLNDKKNVSEAKDIWEPRLSSLTELQEDDTRLNDLNSEDNVDDEFCPTLSLHSSDGQQYVAGYLAKKVRVSQRRVITI